jgi:hypothetical protein
MQSDRCWPTKAGAILWSRVCGGKCLPAFLAAVLLLVAGISPPAFAHTAERAFVLTLPTDLYITGGAVVVAVSFLLVALIPVANARAVGAIGWPAGRLPDVLGTVTSLVTFLVMIALIFAGHFGTQDPLANPLPLVVWTLWWVGLTAAHALFGNLWSAMNPWRGICKLLSRAPGLAGWIARPPLRYPDWLGYGPAIAFFLAFAWFELIFTVPQNPEILADAVSLYFVVNLIGTLLFGTSQWLRYGEAFSVFFRMVSWLSPLNGRPEGEPSTQGDPAPGRVVVTLPGLGLLHVRPLPVSGVAFVLLALSSVSFDGLSKTYWWLGLIEVNPLDFPGRSAVALPNTLGLLAVFAALMCCYVAAVWLGHLLSGEPRRLSDRIGSNVISIVPIALGYHFAHYLTAFLVDAQYAAMTLTDPFGQGWDLFGLDHAHVTTSFLTNFHSVRLIWHCQIAIIVIAHVAAVSIAHFIAIRQMSRRRSLIVSQIPLTILMVGYTQFGLWLLSSATVG